MLDENFSVVKRPVNDIGLIRHLTAEDLHFGPVSFSPLSEEIYGYTPDKPWFHYQARIRFSVMGYSMLFSVVGLQGGNVTNTMHPYGTYDYEVLFPDMSVLGLPHKGYLEMQGDICRTDDFDALVDQINCFIGEALTVCREKNEELFLKYHPDPVKLRKRRIVMGGAA